MFDIYDRLASYLDTLPAGYPPTEDGLELQILRKLFTEEEAELALHLMILDEPVPVIAKKAGLEQDYTAKLLECMVQKGLISGSYPEGKPPVYSISQFVVGFMRIRSIAWTLSWQSYLKPMHPSILIRGLGKSCRK